MNLVPQLILSVVLLVLKLALKISGVHGQGIYTAVSPPFIYPQADYIINVFSSGSLETAFEFSAQIICGRFTYENTTKTLPDGPLKINVRVEQIEGTSCNLTLTAKQGGNDPTEKSATVPIGREDFLLIQTEKPIYRPKEKVQFRVILLDRHGKPKSGRINIGVRDSRKNLVKLWSNVTSDNFGVFRDHLELSYEPNLGEWKIDATTTSSKKYVTFGVREYVLPKVKVEVELPDFSIIDEFPKSVPISIRAKYTYGEFVKGTCDVEVTLLSKDCKGDSRRNLKSNSFPIDGIASQNIDVNPRIIAKVKNGSKLEFRVTLTEAVTNRIYVKEISMPLLKYSYQIKALEKLSYHGHGLPYLVDFHILNRKNELIKNPSDTVTIEHNFQEGIASASVPVKDGIVSCNFTETNKDGDQRFIKVTYKSFVLRYVVPERMMDYHRISATKDALVLELLPRSSINHQIKLFVKSTAALQSVNYLIVSYQEIISLGTIQLAAPSKHFAFNIPVFEALSSDATLFVFTYIDEGYIGDFVGIQKSSDRANFLKVILSNDKVEPGKNMSLMIEAKPASLIALRAIDQSALLLAGHSDLTQDSLEEEYRSGSSQNRNKQPLDLDRSGLVVLTNARKSQDHIARFVRDPLEDVCTSPKGQTGSETEGGTSIDAVIRRSRFAETWLWEEVLMNSSNTLSKSITAPDTLTSWIITGYSINPQFGIEFVTQSNKLTTFKQFFLTLDLPYSVIQGEQLVLKIIIHNYLPGSDSQQVSVKVNNINESFAVGSKINGGENKKSVSCGAKSECPISFVIIPSKIGLEMLNIQATTAGTGDTVVQPLLVTPSGEKIVVTKSKVFQNANLESDGSVPRFKIDLPADRVQGGDSIKLSFSSDILSSPMDHLENLLDLPSGCGEQNMFVFVNNLAILRYLDATNRLTSQVKEKAVKFLELGYQRQLTFRTLTGSFSMFQVDSIGSTTLTAFVIRYFLAARQFISIEEDIITKGLEFLKVKLVKARAKSALFKFIEDGHVNDSQLAIRDDPEGVLLTAYCTLTFLEAYEDRFGNLDILGDIINKGRLYWDSYDLANKEKNKNGDPYADTMLTYAEYAWNNVKGKAYLFRGDEYFGRVQRHSKTHGTGLKHWENNSEDLAVAVEMTSYILLTYLYRNETQEALPLVRWLVLQQNANGGFYSTKDTIIGLSALARYAEMTQNSDLNLQVEVSHLENVELVSQPDKRVAITPNNAALLHEIFFPSNTTHVQVKTTGTGTLYTQVSWSYHVNKVVTKKGFEIRIIKIDDVPRTLGLRICTKYTGKAKSNMAIIEVNLPSGYTFDPETLNALGNATNFKRQELKRQNEKLDIYFDFIPKEPETCIYVEAMRSFKVGKTSSAIVRVYDYYETSRKAVEYYTVPEVNFCEICKDTQDCDQRNCLD